MHTDAEVVNGRKQPHDWTQTTPRGPAKGSRARTADASGIPPSSRGLGDATEMYLAEISGSQLLNADQEKFWRARCSGATPRRAGAWSKATCVWS